jgi:hypothetical protein
MIDIAYFIFELIFYVSEERNRPSKANVVFTILIFLMLIVFAFGAFYYQQEPKAISVPTVFS